MDNKFKVGDIVKIVNAKGIHCVPLMRKFVNKITVINHISSSKKIYVKGNDFYWKEENLIKLCKCIFSND